MDEKNTQNTFNPKEVNITKKYLNKNKEKSKKYENNYDYQIENDNENSYSFQENIKRENSNDFSLIKICCNCKKSKCLKLYCECFSSGILCKDCNCLDCLNLENFIEEVNKAKQIIKEKNPNAFLPKINEDVNKHLKGCKCKNSFCKKKYCECFQSGIACTELCKCNNCENGKI